MGKKRWSGFIFPSKKGFTNEMFFNIFELVLAFIVVLSLFNFVNSVAKQTIFEKNYLARDLAVLLNTLYAAPGNVVYSYHENSNNDQYVFDFRQNKVEVYGKEENGQNKKEFYPFADNNKINLRYKTIENDKESIDMDFSKSGNYIDVSKPSK